MPFERPEKSLRFNNSNKLPVVVQNETSECGLACIAMILGYYEYKIDLFSLRQRFSISAHGTTLRQLMTISSQLNLSSRAVKVGSENLSKLQTPCIVHWSLNHFVVLKSVKRNKLTVHDPATGEKTIGITEWNDNFTGIALELYPTAQFQKVDETKKLPFSHFWSKIIGLKRSLIHIFVLALVLQVFAILSPFFMQLVVDDVLLSNDIDLLLTLTIGFGFLLFIQTITTLLRSYVLLHFTNKLSVQMSSNLFRHLIRLPMDYFYRRHIGDVVSRFGSLSSITHLITTGLVSAIIDGIMAILTLVVMFIYSVQLGIIVVSTVSTYAFIRYILYKPLKRATEESIVASALHDSHFLESIRAMQTIKIFQKESERQSRWHNVFIASLNKKIVISNWNIAYDTINQLLFGIANLVVVFFGAISVIDGIMSIGMLYAFMSYKMRFTGSIEGFISYWIAFKMLDVHLERLSDIVFTPLDSSHDLEGKYFSEASFHSTTYSNKKLVRLEVNNLGFRYGENDKHVFQNLSFVIEHGESVAIIGASGCGKTTLIKCLMGLLVPTEGEILLNGVPILQIPSYRSQIAGVMQEDQLLSGSILENIACFEQSIETERVVDCAQRTCIDNDIVKMAMQYETLVGDMGSAVSGGQKQRILLARALYRKPTLLFLDEATSHLDSDKEEMVNENIKQLDMTKIIVAHRPSTIKTASRIIDMTK